MFAEISGPGKVPFTATVLSGMSEMVQLMSVFRYSRTSVAIGRKVRVHDVQRGHDSSSTRRVGQCERNEWQEVYKVSHNELGVAKKRMLDEKERK